MSSRIFHFEFCHFRKIDETCIFQICVYRCLLNLEEYIQVLTYLTPCYDKAKSFFALLPGLELSHSVFLPGLS